MIINSQWTVSSCSLPLVKWLVGYASESSMTCQLSHHSHKRVHHTAVGDNTPTVKCHSGVSYKAKWVSSESIEAFGKMDPLLIQILSFLGCLSLILACSLTDWWTEIIVLGGQTMCGGYSDDLTRMLGKQLVTGRKGWTSKAHPLKPRDKALVVLTRCTRQCQCQH